MKLVDILARELKVWPKGSLAVTQDDDGAINHQLSLGTPEFSAEMNIWKRLPGDLNILDGSGLTLSDDYKTAIVTRAEWQAAVDALNAPKVVEWDGSGRPPEGTVCGVWYKGCDQGECTVLFMGAEVGVFKNHAFDHEQHGDLVHYSFYKVENSTEEKDAQERKKAIAEMTAIAGGQYSPRDSIVQRLYDAGYRKQVAK